MSSNNERFTSLDVGTVLQNLAVLQPEEAAAEQAVRRAIDRIGEPPTPALRRDRMSRKLSLHAAALVALVLVIAWFGSVFHWTGTTLAFADSAAAVAKTKSVKYRQVNQHEYFDVDDNGRKKPVRTYETSFTIHALPSGKFRYEDGPLVVIYDPATRKRLSLIRSSKQAFLEQVAKDAPKEPNIYVDFRKVEKLKLHRLGRKQIGDQEAIGFQVERDNAPWKKGTKLWIDVRTRLPIRVESESATVDGKHTSTHVLEEFVWDGKINADEFSMTPPDGYRLTPAEGTP